jgi:flavoprotein
LVATFLCANRAGTVATVRIEITDVQTTNALTAASKGTSKDFARMCSVRIAIFLVT